MMTSFRWLAALAVVAMSLGCGARNRGPAVNVQVDPERGVQVDAPGVKVDVGADQGVNVDAPGTEVRLPGREDDKD